ncbi:MAG: C25 family cysteine peptidase [Acidobacteriota bacterium]
MPRTTPGSLISNGINGANGKYFRPAMTAAEISAVACAEPPAEDIHLRELRWWAELTRQRHLGPREGIDPKNLAEAGWGVIFSHDAKKKVLRALAPLLAHRRAQASRRSERFYREFTGADGYRAGESKLQFLARHGVGHGPADPRKMPYYLLLVGGPSEIPFRFQYQLDVQYAVGRLDLDGPQAYRRYARSVVRSETRRKKRSRRAVFFGVKNRGDRATEISHDHLVRPLAKRFAKKAQGWKIRKVLGQRATKKRLLTLIGGKKTPDLLFTASHGVGFPAGHKRQEPHQGALLCQDWPGPAKGSGKVSQEVYLAGDDVADDARLAGLVSLHFACFGAGTPRLDEFAHRSADVQAVMAPHDFVARLPQRLLGHPRGGALAVIGHVERCWSHSFLGRRAGRQLQVYQSLLQRLFAGHPVGSAMEYFDQRYAELSSDLAEELEELRFGRTLREAELAGLWTARNDARSFIVLGDPAVRLK